MTSDEVGARPSEKDSEKEKGGPPDYVIEWKKIATAYSHNLLVATLTFSYSDPVRRTRNATLVLGRVIEECIEDPFNRFVFWLTADLRIQRTPFDDETRRAVRADLARTVKPLSELQVTQMNARVNSLPDYLRAFYLQDYFDSFIKNMYKHC